MKGGESGFAQYIISQILVMFNMIEKKIFLFFILTDCFSSLEDLWSVLLKDLYLISKGSGLFVMNTLLHGSVSFAICELSAYSFWPSTFVHYM